MAAAAERMNNLKRIIWSLLKALGLFLAYELLIRALRKRFHFPAPGRFLDSDPRRALQPPSVIMARSGIGEGMQVLEVGCGSGCYTTAVARAVGPRGHVYALDIQAGMLRQLAHKLARPENGDIQNVTLLNRSAYELPFADGTLDLVYTITVLQEIPDPLRALQEAFRALKPGGIMAVTEWLPDPDYALATTTMRLGRAAGFAVEAAPGNLWHYTVRFRKPEGES
jgi:ubiquinone/menaquinone biosynthesis C-methylase UbiE